MHELPARTAEAEDLFVSAWLDADDLDLDVLTEVITAAMEARRPKLAARLVQILPDVVDVEPGSALERATRAASLLLVDADSVPLFNALDDAWRDARRKRMRRMVARQRLVGTNQQYTIPRVGRRPRKR